MSDSEDPIALPDDAGDDLFGDGGDDIEAQSENERVLSDKDLVSDQDAGEHDARENVEMEGQEVKDKLIYEIQMYRHRTPTSKNGSLGSLKIPNFIKIAAEEYKPDTFEPIQWDLDNVKDDNPKNVVRYRKDSTTGKLKSNAAVHRWSDGSITISVGGEHYEVTKKQMAPSSDKPYQENQDSHLYAAAAHLSSNLLLTVGHVTEQYTVLPSKHMRDDALATFAARMAEAARGKTRDDNIFTATRDPELQRKEAELAEKERQKAQRRRENAAARISGAGGYRSGGLSIGDLEGGRRAPGGARKRGQPGGSRPKKRRPEYDSDDDLPAGHGRNDEYDRDDDFIAPSDEENISEEDEEDDLLEEDDEDEAPRNKKRQKTAEPEDEDADADTDLDGEPVTRSRRRQILDDDEDS